MVDIKKRFGKNALLLGAALAFGRVEYALLGAGGCGGKPRQGIRDLPVADRAVLLLIPLRRGVAGGKIRVHAAFQMLRF